MNFTGTTSNPSVYSSTLGTVIAIYLVDMMELQQHSMLFENMRKNIKLPQIPQFLFLLNNGYNKVLTVEGTYFNWFKDLGANNLKSLSLFKCIGNGQRFLYIIINLPKDVSFNRMQYILKLLNEFQIVHIKD